MKFWKEHTGLRTALMALTFFAGFFLLIFGWKQTGTLGGLGLMLVGVALLRTTLYLYNARFAEPRNRKPR